MVVQSRVEIAGKHCEDATSADAASAQCPAELADRVVELLDPADRARDRDDMGAGARDRDSCRVADAARGAGDERDPVSEGL